MKHYKSHSMIKNMILFVMLSIFSGCAGHSAIAPMNAFCPNDDDLDQQKAMCLTRVYQLNERSQSLEQYYDKDVQKKFALLVQEKVELARCNAICPLGIQVISPTKPSDFNEIRDRALFNTYKMVK